MQTILSNEEIVQLAPSAGATSPHEIASDRYSFVSTLEAVDILRGVGWLPISIMESGVRKPERQGYQKHVIRFLKDGLDYNGERVDLVLTNSHDCGTAFQLSASVWRKICKNGLMVSADLASFSHKHIGFDQIDFAESALEIASSAGEIADRVNTMKSIELTADEKGVFAMAAHQLVYDEPEEAPITPDQLLEERRYDDEGNNLWTIFNVVQENIIKGGLYGRKRDKRGRIRRVKTRPVKSINRDIKLNRALWTITEEMAKLKG